jgi:hypothetical protein
VNYVKHYALLIARARIRVLSGYEETRVKMRKPRSKKRARDHNQRIEAMVPMDRRAA